MTTTEIGWYYVIVCLAAGAAYAAVLYWIGARRMPRGARWVASVARTLAVALLVFLQRCTGSVLGSMCYWWARMAVRFLKPMLSRTITA